MLLEFSVECIVLCILENLVPSGRTGTGTKRTGTERTGSYFGKEPIGS
jgi:hypothetical protein